MDIVFQSNTTKMSKTVKQVKKVRPVRPVIPVRPVRPVKQVRWASNLQITISWAYIFGIWFPK